MGAFIKQILHISRLDDATTIMLEFESGPLGFIGTSMVIPDIAATAVFGTEKAAWSEGDGARFFIQDSGSQERKEQSIETCDTVRDELEEFARCIRGAGRPETGGAEGLEVIVVLEAVLASVRQGRIVELDEIRSG